MATDYENIDVSDMMGGDAGEEKDVTAQEDAPGGGKRGHWGYGDGKSLPFRHFPHLCPSLRFPYYRSLVCRNMSLDSSMYVIVCKIKWKSCPYMS